MFGDLGSFVMLFAALLLLTVPEIETAPAPPSPRTVEDRVICKRERLVGSNRPQKVCMTQRERAQMRDRSRDMMDRSTREQPQPLPGS